MSDNSNARSLRLEDLEARRLLAIFVVDRTDDTNAASAQLCGEGAGDCSLRGAISKANATAGADTIAFDAATNGTPFTLTLVNAGGANEDLNATGDLDVIGNVGLTIIGNGSSNTIIQAGTDATNGIDKVFAFNPSCDVSQADSISGVTIRFGRNTQPNGAADASFTGGGLDFCGTGIADSSFSISNSIVTQNTTVNGYGGGMNIYEVAPAASKVTITNTQFTSNTSTYWGGGLNIFGDNNNVTIRNSTFSNNQTLGTGGVGAQGGGINIRITNQNDGDGAPIPFVNIDNTTIANNQAVGFGGGIDVQGSGDQDVNISNTSITGNSLIVNGGVTNTMGGGIEHSNNLARITTLTNVLIANNTSAGNSISDGGGLAHGSGVLIVRNSTISGNSATRDGGGIHMTTDPTMTLINTTISNNRADSDDNSTGTGGGINKLADAGVLTLNNTISDGNFRGAGATVNEIAGTVTANFSLIGNTAGATLADGSGNNQLNVNGLLGALANNLGPTVGPTGFTAVLQTHALLPGSPAINGGTNTGVPDMDQRGIARPQQLTTDIGAFESRGFTLTKSGGDGQSTNIFTAFPAPLSVSVAPIAAGEPVDGGQVTFTPPGVDAGAILMTSPAMVSGGQASVTATANGTPGSYSVTADARGSSGLVSFGLTNTVPDLTVSKTDTVNNATALGNTWDWRSTISNGGNGPANFANGQTIFTDTMPSTNISYGVPSIGSSSGISGTINCTLNGGNVVLCQASGAVSINAAGSFRVDVTATPSAIGTFTNPTGGSAKVDPDNNVLESNEGNNDSNSDSVVVTCTTTVTTTGDFSFGQGSGSLRLAILCANVTAGTDTIGFAIPGGGVHTIQPAHALPTIADPVVLDGTTQAGFAVGSPVIELDGSLAAAGTKGLTIAAGSSTVRGLAINRFSGVGIELLTGGGNVVEGNFIGTSVSGTLDRGNASDGVLIINSGMNTIGGLTAAARNVISGNDQYGVRVVGSSSTGNLVQGNFIGTNVHGTGILGNSQSGVFVNGGAGNTIGGAVAGSLNVISGNDQHGVYLLGSAATGNQVLGNYIGTDVNGTADLGNALSGVLINGAPNNTIGGTVAEVRNVISGNDQYGVYVLGSTATGNLVQGNLIGTNVNGTAALGNTFSGVLVSGVAGNVIGGTTATARNVISGNQQNGVSLSLAGATGNLVQGNFIGTDLTGTVDLGNASSGVLVNGAPGNTIGGTAVGSRNVISGNDQHGVYLRGSAATGNRVLGNYIGTDVNGTGDLGNSLSGVLVSGAPGNTIGGATFGARNVISGNNQYGVYLSGPIATGNLVQGNFIGTDVNGTGDLGNTLSGVLINKAANNNIGGTTAVSRNVISGNDQHGVYLLGSTATGNRVLGNYIGTDVNGTSDLGNTLSGVLVSGAASNFIGSTSASARNVISGNGRHGVYLLGSTATGNRVQGNYIGTNSGGSGALGNSQDGVRISDGSSNTVGGSGAAANKLAFNGQSGVSVLGSGIGNAILGNSMFSNVGLGIDLNGDGVTPNDVNDPDAGPNKLQNFPVITSVVLSGAKLNVTYSVPSVAPNSTFPLRVEFFLADDANQEGRTFLGSNSYAAGGTKYATIPAGAAVLGSKIVATATDNGGSSNTSEFSANATVASSLLVARGAAPAGAAAAANLTPLQLRPIVDAAISRLAAQGLTAAQVRRLSSVTFTIADLPGGTLGLAKPNAITLDVNAAGYGWYVDPTPRDDSEYASRRVSPAAAPLVSRTIDLLTAVMHEFGHVLGRDDLTPSSRFDDLMSATLAPSVRRTTAHDAVFADSGWSQSLLTQ